MRCPCSYIFDLSADIDHRPFRSFALIDDWEYEHVMQLERELHAAQIAGDDDSKLDALAASSRHVSTLFECPDCRRLIKRRADDHAIESYRLE